MANIIEQTAWSIGNGELNDDERTLYNKILTWLNESEGSIPESRWRTDAEESYEFYSSNQDTPEVLKILQDQKRPNSTYNKIFPKVNMLCGIAAQSNRTPYVFPVGAEDAALEELMNDAFKHFRYQSLMPNIENECFEHMVKSGRSFMAFYIDDENPFWPKIKVKRIPGRDVRLDPMSKEYDLSDARYIFVDRWFHENDLLARWPQIDTATIRTLSQSSIMMPIFYDSVRDKYRVTECWYRQYVDTVWFQNPFNGKVEDLPPEQFEQFNQAVMEGIQLPNGQNLQLPQGVQGIPKKKKQVFYMIFSAYYILERGPSPYKHAYFPYVPYFGYKNENENWWFGAITMMKDPQRGINTMRRQLQHLLQTAPKNIMMHEVGAIINEEAYDKRSSEPNFRLQINRGYFDKVKFSDQPTISPIYVTLDELFEQDLKDISGAQDSLLGIQTSSREPGITVRMRQQTGMAVLYILFDNFKKSRIMGGKILLNMIQQYMTQEQLIRVTGPEGIQLVQINSQMNPQSQGFNDLSAGDFDLTIDEAMDSTTMRMAIAQMLTDYSQNNPGQIPPDIIMEYSDMPLSVRNRIQQYNAAMMQREDEKFYAELAAKREGNVLSTHAKLKDTDAKVEVAEKRGSAAKKASK